MSENHKLIETSRMHGLLMQYKYRDAIKKLTKGITHDYNNIFAGLSGQITNLLRENAGAVSAKRKRLIEELLQRGIEQTEILFDFSRDAVSTKSSHSPGRLARRATALLNSVSRLHHFELDAESNLPKISTNQRDIILMLFYIGENAIESMNDGGVIGLKLSYVPGREGAGYIRFNMSDSGIGFPTEMKGIGPDPFRSMKQAEDVYGFGLYAVQTIVAEHGGILSFSENSEGGTIVTVDLPVLQDSENVDQDKDTSGVSKQLSDKQEKYVFLVVDDDEVIRDVLLQSLQRRGHVVFCVESCAEAVEEFEMLSDIITVVLLDIGLKDASGYTCARKLRSIQNTASIILMSGQDLDDEAELESGTLFIQKPFSIESVEQMVQDAQIQC